MVTFTYSATGIRKHPEKSGFQRLRLVRSDELKLELAIEGAESHGYVFNNRVRLGRRVEEAS